MNKQPKKRMLITGVSGLLGSNLAFCLKSAYDIVGVYHAHPFEMEGIHAVGADLGSTQDVLNLFEKFDPDIVVHSAAQADVDMCEERPQEAEYKNVLTTQAIVNCLKDRQCKLVFVSTDLVYDGIQGNYCEDDPVNPRNCYGRTKLKAEREVLTLEHSLVLRTNFFGWNFQDKYSLAEWVIHELSENNEIKGFTDCIFSGIYTFEIADLLDAAIQHDLAGVYHCVSSTSTAKYDFACDIARQLNLNMDLISPSSIDDFDFKAKRSKDLSLNTGKLARGIGCDVPPVSRSIERFVKDFQSGIPQIIKSFVVRQNGHSAAPDFIPYGSQKIDEEDIQAVIDVLRSKPLTQGPKIREFESALCAATDASHGVAVNSGTAGLHIACLAAGVGPGDEVITSANTFVASANCAVYCRAKPVFADIDPRTYNITSGEIEQKITERTKAVIPVHFAGQSCDMEVIQQVVEAAEKKYGHKITIIEDACHALGSRYKKTKIGSCTYSDMAVFSFHPVKHITMGEGGAVLTNDPSLRRKLSLFRSHGITSTPEEILYKEHGLIKDSATGEFGEKNPWYYEQLCLGYNYRITDIQCALGISQLNKLGVFLQKRRELVNRYNSAFKNVDWLTIPYEANFNDSNFHLYVLQIDFKKLGLSRARVMTALREQGIQTQVHYIPVYTQPYYRKNLKTRWGTCPVTEQYYRHCLSIPLHPKMTNADSEKVIAAMLNLVRHREMTLTQNRKDGTGRKESIGEGLIKGAS